MASGVSDRVPPALWTLVVPVKPAGSAKSRLAVPGLDKAALARAIARDTVEAASACAHVERVVVVTPRGRDASVLASIERVTVVEDTATGLRSAIALGLAAAGETVARGVLLGDLPALRPSELSFALARAALLDLAFVPDADGTGTTLSTARPGIPLPPLFGPGSAAAHRRAGFAEMDVPVSSGLRRDVDVAEHLTVARQSGLGRHTAAIAG